MLGCSNSLTQQRQKHAVNHPVILTLKIKTIFKVIGSRLICVRLINRDSPT